MAKNLRAKIQDLEQKIIDLKSVNQNLSASIETEKKFHEDAIKILNSQWEQKEENTKSTYDFQILGLENQVENLDKELVETKLQRDKRETKKLAQSYEDQEEIYKAGTEKWLEWLIKIGIALIVSTVLSIYLSSDEKWYDKFEYYLVDIIFLSAVWFCGAQYTDQAKLRNDYANRKVIAQSFNNILNNLPEDEPIKSKFIEKATDVLCASNPVSGKEPVLSKKVIKDTAEILSSFKGL